LSQRPRRTVHIVIRARQARDAASGLRQVAAAIEGVAVEAHVELDLSERSVAGAIKDAALTDQVTQAAAGALDELAAAVQTREQEIQAGKSVPRPKTVAETQKTLVQRVEAFTRAGARILVAVKGLADVIVSTFYPRA
jgi:hypothetical protein